MGMIPVKLVDASTNEALHTEGYFSPEGKGRVLLVTTLPEHYGVFKSATYNNETATLVEPTPGGSLQLTDLIITSGLKVGGTATVQFYDGTNTVLIAKPDADRTIQLSTNFSGGWQGWKDAYIQVIVSLAFDVTVSIGYVKIPKEGTLSYSAWDAQR